MNSIRACGNPYTRTQMGAVQTGRSATGRAEAKTARAGQAATGRVAAAQAVGRATCGPPGTPVAEIVAKTGIPRTSLYRHLPPRPPEPVTARRAAHRRSHLYRQIVSPW